MAVAEDKKKKHANAVGWINSERNKDSIMNYVAADRNSNPRPVSLSLSSLGEYTIANKRLRKKTRNVGREK